MKNDFNLNESFKQSTFTHTVSFEVNKHTAMILADPCYKEGIMELIHEGEQSSFPVEGTAIGGYFPRMKKGTYRVEIQTIPGSKNTASWVCKHQDTSTYETEVGLEVMVDSGQVGLFFAHTAYQAEAVPKDEIQLKSMEYEGNDLHPWYTYMCATSLNYFYQNAMGICTDSGYGDGCYFAYAFVNEEDEVVAIEITFDEPDNEWDWN